MLAYLGSFQIVLFGRTTYSLVKKAQIPLAVLLFLERGHAELDHVLVMLYRSTYWVHACICKVLYVNSVLRVK